MEEKKNDGMEEIKSSTESKPPVSSLAASWGSWLSSKALIASSAISDATLEASKAIQIEAKKAQEIGSTLVTDFNSGSLQSSIKEKANGLISTVTNISLTNTNTTNETSNATNAFVFPWEVEPVLISYSDEIIERVLKLSSVDLTFTITAEEDFVFDLDQNVRLIKAIMELDKKVNLARLRHVKPGGLSEYDFFRNYLYRFSLLLNAYRKKEAKVIPPIVSNKETSLSIPALSLVEEKPDSKDVSPLVGGGEDAFHKAMLREEENNAHRTTTSEEEKRMDDLLHAEDFEAALAKELEGLDLDEDVNKLNSGSGDVVVDEDLEEKIRKELGM